MKHGIIRGMSADFDMGLAGLIVADIDNGDVEVVYADNGPLVRQLDACFPGTINRRSHTINADVLVGQEIVYEVGMFNMLESFAPAEIMA